MNEDSALSEQLSARVQRMKPSATIAVSMKAAELKAQGINVIGLGAGEPDFDTPDHIKQAAIEAIQAGDTKYTAVDGTAALKRAIAGKLKRDHGLDYEANEIIVSSGAKQSIFNLLQALINPGDEVIIPAPFWVSYPDMAGIVDGKPVIIQAGQDQSFKISATQLKAALTENSRLLVLNAPSNPTGKAYTEQELAALGDVIAEHPRLMVVSDEIYEYIYWGQTPLKSLLQVRPDLKSKVVLVNGVSKAYAMTGWRIGYAAGPAQLIAGMRKVQGQSTSNPCSISQAASVAAINGDQSCIRTMRTAFKQRHDYVVEALNRLPGVNCLSGDGAFYAFPGFQQVIDRLDGVDNDVVLAERILEQAKVALVPGSAFGMPGHLRLSYATSMEILKEAMGRLEAFLNT